MVRKVVRRTRATKRAPVRRAVRRAPTRRTVRRAPVKRAVRRTATRRTVRRAPVKRAVRRTATRRRVRRPARPAKPAPQRIGRVSHFFTNIKVAVVDVENPIRIGDKLLIEGATTAMRQTATSIQINRNPVTLAQRGKSIGLRVRNKCRVNDVVYKL